MAKYLIDVNLPYRFSLWKSDDYIHQIDVNDEWTSRFGITQRKQA
jgi:hypothetical protein